MSENSIISLLYIRQQTCLLYSNKKKICGILSSETEKNCWILSTPFTFERFKLKMLMDDWYSPDMYWTSETVSLTSNLIIEKLNIIGFHMNCHNWTNTQPTNKWKYLLSCVFTVWPISKPHTCACNMLPCKMFSLSAGNAQ